MVYRKIPALVDRVLWAEGMALCEVDSPEWFAWLEEEATHFSYLPKYTSYRFTFRKEIRIKSYNWFAYVKADSKFYNIYVGSSSSLSEEKLKTVAQLFLSITKRGV